MHPPEDDPPHIITDRLGRGTRSSHRRGRGAAAGQPAQAVLESSHQLLPAFTMETVSPISPVVPVNT
jgi:hypothetical protein